MQLSKVSILKYTLIDNHSVDDVDGKNRVGREGIQVKKVSQRNL